MATTVYRGPNIVIEYDPSKTGIAACAVGPEISRELHRIVAERALPYALAISQPFRRTGEYASSFQVRETTVTMPAHHPMRRTAVRLWNMSSHAAVVEWGNVATKGDGHHVLRRVLEHLQSTGH